VLKKKDGTPLLVETSSHLYYDSNGNVAGVEGILRDITERKLAEDELRRSERLLNSIINASPIPQFVINREHRVIHWNRALEKYSGIPAEEMIGTSGHWRAFYKKARPCLADLLIDKKNEMISVWYEGKYKNSGIIDYAYEAVDYFPDMKNGIWLYFTAAPIFDERGEIIGAVETLNDVTESKKNEEVIKESEERFRTIFNDSPLGIVQTTLNGRILSANKVLCDMMDYDNDEIVNLTIGDISFEGDFEKERPLVRKLRDGSSNYYSFEKRYRTRKGEAVWAHVSIAYIHDSKGQPSSAIGIVENITDRKIAEDEIKRMENQLIQSQKAEALGTLAGGIAHDFNNLLAAIIGYAELAKIHIDNKDKAIREINEVLKASDKAKNLVNQILTFSRKTRIDYTPVELYSAITDSLKMLRSVIPADIEIRQSLEEKVIVMSEPTQIHQIIMNLSINAAQAMEREGGVLAINLSSVNLGNDDAAHLELNPGYYAKITVSDTGMGMPGEIRDRIFLPYFTTKEKGRGTGLGLAVIHGIVKKHEGTIVCQSTPGKGTVFDIYLPEVKTISEIPSRPHDEQIITGKGTILFVDDEPSLAAIASEMLKTLGYNVISETSSVKAFEIFMEKPDTFDLVITDMTMPVMTGDRLAEKLMSVRGDLPVIICTGYSERLSDERINELGIRRLCMKPIELKTMAEIIHEVLNRK
jgi:PAS domain S-box-containing protein